MLIFTGAWIVIKHKIKFVVIFKKIWGIYYSLEQRNFFLLLYKKENLDQSKLEKDLEGIKILFFKSKSL